MGEHKGLGLVAAENIRVRDFKRPAEEIIDRFRDLPDPAGLVARALDYFGLAGAIPATVLKPLHPGRMVVGPAVTVRNIPHREVPYRRWQERQRTQLGEREAYMLIKPGDVVVIDGSSVFPASCLGSMSVTVAGRLGCAGVLVAGAVTGVAGIQNNETPVWARGGTNLTGHHRAATIEINGPIGVNGVRVEPGDLVVADDSGVSIVGAEHVDLVYQRALEMKEMGSTLKQLLVDKADKTALRDALADFMQNLTRGSD